MIKKYITDFALERKLYFTFHWQKIGEEFWQRQMYIVYAVEPLLTYSIGQK